MARSSSSRVGHRAAFPVRSGGDRAQAISPARTLLAIGRPTETRCADDRASRRAAFPTPARTSSAGTEQPDTPQTLSPSLPPRLQRRRLPHPRRAPPGPPAARAPEDRDGAGRARHRLDRGDVRQRPHPRSGARSRGARAPGLARLAPFYDEARDFARLCAERALADRQPRGRRLHRRRPRHHGGGQPRRRRGRRHLGQPQHRAAARAGPEPLRHARAQLQLPLLRHPQDALPDARPGDRGVPRRLRHPRRALRGADAGADRPDGAACRSCCSARRSGAGSSTGRRWSRPAPSPPRDLDLLTYVGSAAEALERIDAWHAP